MSCYFGYDFSLPRSVLGSVTLRSVDSGSDFATSPFLKTWHCDFSGHDLTRRVQHHLVPTQIDAVEAQLTFQVGDQPVTSPVSR